MSEGWLNKQGVNSTTVVVPQPSSTAIDTFTPPDVYSQTFVNLQAIVRILPHMPPFPKVFTLATPNPS